MFKRFGLFALVNIGVLVTVSLVLNLLGIRGYMTARGINYESLLLICAVYGIAGSFISLLLSKFIAKRMMGLQVIDPARASGDERRLVDLVHRLAQAANLPRMPEVAIYASPEVNAFATGPSKSNSLVAVSSGLLTRMDRQEVEAVLGHEVSHIANGDMVTMALLQGVINAFVLFFAKLISWAAANAMRSNDDEAPSFGLMFALEMALQIVFGLLGSIVVCWFSRQREFRADAGAARLVGAAGMVAALRRLQSVHGINEETHGNDEMVAAFKIDGRKAFLELLATHPSLAERIARLQRV